MITTATGSGNKSWVKLKNKDEEEKKKNSVINFVKLTLLYIKASYTIIRHMLCSFLKFGKDNCTFGGKKHCMMRSYGNFSK